MSDGTDTAQVEPEMTVDAALERLRSGSAMLDAVMWHEIHQMDETLWLALRTIVEHVASVRGVHVPRSRATP